MIMLWNSKTQLSCYPSARSTCTLRCNANVAISYHFHKTVHTCWSMQKKLPWGGKRSGRKRSRKAWEHTPTQNLRFRDLSAMLCWQERELGEKLTVLQSDCCSALLPRVTCCLTNCKGLLHAVDVKESSAWDLCETVHIKCCILAPQPTFSLPTTRHTFTYLNHKC